MKHVDHPLSISGMELVMALNMVPNVQLSIARTGSFGITLLLIAILQLRLAADAPIAL